ncbi:Hypothetical predicted protein [Octopus vulgaris]|uniref:Uncharacterized protein n=1 Tax=Octopus vulgaris TaxID=6645 RepID=A0AA36BLY9_OCTVU|nr:Hypothetical predicted protein [Octopus vulgaris]
MISSPPPHKKNVNEWARQKHIKGNRYKIEDIDGTPVALDMDVAIVTMGANTSVAITTPGINGNPIAVATVGD